MLHCPRDIIRHVIYSGMVLATGLVPALAADPTGDWRVADGVADIRVAECNGSMWGAVVWEKTPGGRDKNNPDASKQNRPTLGMPILLDMKKKPAADQWEGQVYNAKDGQFYSTTIRPIGADQLEIQGCVLGFLCGGETWTRVSGPIPSSQTSPSQTSASQISPSATNSMAKGPTTTTGALPKAAAPTTTATAPKSAAPVNPAPKMPGQKLATAAPPADPVGDICLLPDIARFSH
jgi:uncharacterized protein (DUF2147 family)